MITLLIGLICFVAGFFAHIICVRIEKAEANINRIFEEESDRQEWSDFYNQDQITNEKPMNE